MRKKILILEDNGERIKKFKEILSHNHDLTITSTTAECIVQLQKERFDIIFLDHDLDGKVYVPSGPGTGYEVAQYIAGNIEPKDLLIVLHTHNEGGALEMKKALENFKVIIAPFFFPTFTEFVLNF